jgi:alkanesulfonate monooxygenase SsuD/methylene tetrahydromethanopterin reductase-like flavin-dependent oxidoreductase (luciferase family)
MIDTSRLALGIHPNSVLSVAEMVDCARLAEAKDFAATWVAEGHRGDVFALLSALAMSTSKIRLGAGILPVLVRSPWVVAMGAAAVDEISGGRFMLGLGAGHKSIIEDRHGLAYDRPTLRMREVTQIVRCALSREPVNFQGEIFRLSGAQLSAQPVRSYVPVYIAGIGPRVLELAGEIADGAFLMFPTESSLKTSLTHIAAGAARANRNPGKLDVVAYVFTCVATDRQAAIASSRRTIAYFGRLPHYRSLFAQEGFSREAAALRDAWKQNDDAGAMRAVSDEMVLTLSASGTADDVAARISALLKAGLKQAVLFPLAADGDASGAILRTIEALS